jgi:uncharacterized protein
MSTKSMLRALIFAATALLAASVGAADPTLSQVYQAAESGNIAEAQQMMREVLAAHPDSAKAHYVEAELLAKQGRTAGAQAELSTAERLEPGLPFAKPQAVAALRREISAPSGILQSAAEKAGSSSSGGIPWPTLVGVAVVALIVVAFLAMRQRRPTYMPAVSPAGYIPPTPGQPVGVGPMGPSAGVGSGLLGSLATGAAIGGGLVAGEALAHHLIDGRPSGEVIPAARGNDAGIDASTNSDLGGNDFGVADSGSWDDGFSGGAGGGDSWS